MKDFQVEKVYAWERKLIPVYDKSLLTFDMIEPIINHVWQAEGLLHPPRLKETPSTKHCFGNRTGIWVNPKVIVSTCNILHELSHSMTSNMDEYSDHHREQFVGVYMKLLAKYIGIPLEILTFTAGQEDLKFDIMATPWCKD